jgi:hypothetical protein
LRPAQYAGLDALRELPPADDAPAPAPLALVFGILAIRDIQPHPNRHGMGRAIFGIVMEILGSVLLVFGLIGAIGGRH